MKENYDEKVEIPKDAFIKNIIVDLEDNKLNVAIQYYSSNDIFGRLSADLTRSFVGEKFEFKTVKEIMDRVNSRVGSVLSTNSIERVIDFMITLRPVNLKGVDDLAVTEET